MKYWPMLLATLFSFPLEAQDLQVQWSFRSPESPVGKELILTLQVTGTDDVLLPELREEGVDTRLLSRQPLRSTTTMTVNGRTSTVTELGYRAVWGLKASRPGRFSLRNYKVMLSGRPFILPDLEWTVSPPKEVRNFRFFHSLEPMDLVPGLEAEYTLRWFLGDTAQDPEFHLPLLESGAFQWLEPAAAPPGDRITLEYGGRTLEGEKSADILDGKQYTVLTFRLRLRALKALDLDLGNTSLSFQGAVSYREYYDFFGDRKREPVFETMTIPANPLRVLVRDFPAEGRPDPFSGLVGNLKLDWKIPPGPFKTGESLALGLVYSGLLNHPDLDWDLLVREAFSGTPFRVSGGTPLTGGGREYTLRPASSGRLSLPGIRLNYFDPKTRTYAWAQTGEEVVEVENPGGDPLIPEAGEKFLSGYRAPDRFSRSFSSYLPVLLLPPAGALAFLALSLWSVSDFRNTRRRRKQIRKELRGLAIPPAEHPVKDSLVRGLKKLRALETSLTVLAEEGKGMPGLEALKTSLDQEMAIWEKALYSPGLPEWKPENRITQWASEAGRYLK